MTGYLKTTSTASVISVPHALLAAAIAVAIFLVSLTLIRRRKAVSQATRSANDQSHRIEAQERRRYAQWTPQQMALAISRLGTDGSVKASGVRLTAEDVVCLVAAAPRVNGRPQFKDVAFIHSQFTGEVNFTNVSFGTANFAFAQFDQGAKFVGAQLPDAANFHAAQFGPQV